MSELLEERKTPKPEWLNLPEEEKLEHTYWTTSGNVIEESDLHINVFKCFSNIYHSKEEAESHSCRPDNKNWIWDKEPAKPTTLQNVMNRARQAGRAGVRIIGYKNGKWVTLKEYPSHIPLNSYKEE
jgi:hypothetical protein